MGTPVTDLLGGPEVLGPNIRSDFDLVRATREGLPTRAVDALAKKIGGAGEVYLQTIVDVVHRSGQSLTPEQSDHVVRVARLVSRATDVFDDPAKAQHWLNQPNKALGGEVPLTLADTSAGEHEVEALLDRIEYGVYS